MSVTMNSVLLKAGSLALSLMAISLSPRAQATEGLQTEPATLEHLALGDSIAFGENGYIPHTLESRPDLRAFVGYPELVAQALYNNSFLTLACPGETSSSLLDSSSPSSCSEFKKALPLKFDYKTSQIEAAVALVRRHPELKAISLSIGGNDFFAIRGYCRTQFPTDAAAQDACLKEKAGGAIYQLYLNVQTTVQTLRTAGFQGRFAFMGNYSLDYRDPDLTAIASGANEIIISLAEVDHFLYVDNFSAFGAKAQAAGGDLCASGLLIKNPLNPLPEGQEPCDVHTSAEGTLTLARDLIESLK